MTGEVQVGGVVGVSCLCSLRVLPGGGVEGHPDRNTCERAAFLGTFRQRWLFGSILAHSFSSWFAQGGDAGQDKQPMLEMRMGRLMKPWPHL